MYYCMYSELTNLLSGQTGMLPCNEQGDFVLLNFIKTSSPPDL